MLQQGRAGLEASAQNIIGDASVGYRHGLIAYQVALSWVYNTKFLVQALCPGNGGGRSDEASSCDICCQGCMQAGRKDQDPLHSASSRRRAAYGIHTQSSEDAESIADRDAALWSRESDWDQVRLLLCTAGTMTCCGRWRATAIS